MEPENKPENRTCCAGWLKRKTIWVPSARAWIVLFLLLGLLGGTIFFGAEKFLAITDRVDAPILAVDGWLPDYGLMAGWQEFKSGHYTDLYTVGGQVKNGWHVEANDTYASWGAARLREMAGVHPEIHAAPALVRKRDRTYASAIGLRDWLAAHHQTATAINVVTMGPHARRSRMLYRDAFGPNVRIGVIAIQDEEYQRGQWWKYSEGLKEVFSEGATYLYALLFLHFGAKD